MLIFVVRAERGIEKIRLRIQVRDEMKDHIHKYCLEMIDKIPSQDAIEDVYRKCLEDTRKVYEKHTPVIYKYDKRDSN